MAGPGGLGSWLRQQREARFWSRAEMARQLITAAHGRGDTSVPGVDHVSHNIYRWERGVVGVGERYRVCYCHALGIPLSAFGRDAVPAEPPRAASSALEALVMAWGDAYDIGVGWHAARRGGGTVIRAGTADGLNAAIRADWGPGEARGGQ